MGRPIAGWLPEAVLPSRTESIIFDRQIQIFAQYLMVWEEQRVEGLTSALLSTADSASKQPRFPLLPGTNKCGHCPAAAREPYCIPSASLGQARTWSSSVLGCRVMPVSRNPVSFMERNYDTLLNSSVLNDHLLKQVGYVKTTTESGCSG
jgi:hypothetical protein